MTAPLVSIVTPSYNQAQFLEEAMRSVLEQSYPSIEYIVVDGGSSDGSVEIIRRYADRLAWWTSEPDAGQAAALNKGLARATGEYLGWLNSDDRLLPGAVSSVVEALERDPDALLAYGGVEHIDERSQRIAYSPPVDTDVATMVRTGTYMVSQQGSLFRRRAWELAGPLNESSYYLFDAEFVLRVGLAGRIARIDVPLAAYRLHDESKTVARPIRRAEDYLRLYDELGARLPADLAPLLAEGRSQVSLWAAELFYNGGDHRRARRSLLLGLRLRPRNLSRRWLVLLAKSLVPEPLVRRLRAAR